MDANALLKRIVLGALVSTLPVSVCVASPGGGGHSSSGSGGGSSSAGSGGHSSGASNSGHSSSVSNGGHSSNVSNSGHSSSQAPGGRLGGSHALASVSNGGHSSTASKGVQPRSDQSTDPPSVVGGRSVSGARISPSTVRKGFVPVANTRVFSSGGSSGRGNWEENDDRLRHHRRLLFGIWPF
jgi:hypothetical protein